MRWQGLLGCMLMIAMLSGCAGDTEQVTDVCADDHHAEGCEAEPHCEDAHAGDLAAGDAGDNATDNATAGNTTGQAALDAGHCAPALGNLTAEPPVPALAMRAADGSLLNGTAILEGETITFSAEGSVAAAGLQAVALTVEEPNGTTTATLYADGAFQDATLTFPRAGIVNVTVRALDDAGQGAALSAKAFVDHPTSGSQDGKLYAPDSSGCSATVSADDQARLIGNMFFHRQTFQVGSNVSWISVQADNVGAVAICDPDGNRIDEGDDGGYAATTAGEWERSTQYFVALHPSGPEVTMEWTIIVHYGAPPA